MKFIKVNKLVALLFMGALTIGFTSCDNDDDNTPDIAAVYAQEDQMGRPAINTVFIQGARKDIFNVTIPSQMGAAFSTEMQDRLLALNAGYSTNALGLDASTFIGVLATDVLTVSLTGTTTFFDGTNVLTGRTLSDDVISTELLLIFGGPDGTANPGLTDDHVDGNDKPFLNTFPYLASPW
ncbi:hypothetical protein BFP97_11710 [Roseivirga sp. 4D4]|uniref:DUF4331 family protein n=1 Tax=Roseivirga sp. 4D4 TaxID=1889784 RepID=UPI00085371A2|nr:hypothetical protein BFP97_11710 [Roseivirga sp. 4D4]